jgi:hypothetical protein
MTQSCDLQGLLWLLTHWAGQAGPREVKGPALEERSESQGESQGAAGSGPASEGTGHPAVWQGVMGGGLDCGSQRGQLAGIVSLSTACPNPERLWREVA